MFNGLKNFAANRISPTRAHLSELRSEVRTRLRSFNNDREINQQQLLEDDFKRVLVSWGINSAAEIPRIIMELRLRFLLFTLPIIVCGATAAISQSFIAYLALAFMTLPCLLGVLTTSWRISILTKQKFTPLLRWIVSGAGFFQKGS